MPRDREASATAPRPALPWLALALLGVAGVAALLGAHDGLPGLFAALALLLTAAACTLAGAAWSRQRQADRLREARTLHQLLGQLVDAWVWQTDREHRLVRLQPPLGAPASSWVDSGASGELLWERFVDPEASLRQRMQAQAPLPELRLHQTRASTPDTAARHWSLRGLPRLDGHGEFAGYIGIARPTDAADAQAVAQDGFDALLRRDEVALCVVRRDGGGEPWRLERASPAACRLLGVDAEALKGLPWEQALAGLPDGLRQRVLALQPGQTADHGGWSAWLEHIGAAGTDRERRLLGLVTCSADPPDAAAQSLAAEHASFSYTVSHDLRAPIRVIDGFTRILKEDYGDKLDRVGNDHLERVMGAAARMNLMIDAMLSLSQLSTQPLARQPVNLSQLAQYVVDELRRGAPQRTATIRIEPGLATRGDPTLLRTALENLLGNAWKYSANCAQAEITFEQVEQDGRKVYRVRDNGAGFDMRFADRLFGVFQRLHSSSDFAGTGVGLASVRRIVRRHGGEIWAESEVGKGASFYFTLQG